MGKIIQFRDKRKQKLEKELVPMEQWNGECWKTMFNTLVEMTGSEDSGWEALAGLIRHSMNT